MDTSGGAGNGYGAAAGMPVRRKSRKKTVDRRASKGRKIKYVTHPKMQNFMFSQVRYWIRSCCSPSPSSPARTVVTVRKNCGDGYVEMSAFQLRWRCDIWNCLRAACWVSSREYEICKSRERTNDCYFLACFQGFLNPSATQAGVQYSSNVFI